jgi:formate dehydrogenase subunit gamma
VSPVSPATPTTPPTTPPPIPPTTGDVLRFDRLTRTVHWTTTALGLVVLATGTVLYVPQLSATIGARATLRAVHLWSGFLAAVPLLVGAATGRAGRRLRHDLVELGRWSAADRRWLRRRTRGPAAGKFNGGQKLVSSAFSGLFVVQLLTGAVLFWHDPFRDSWRTGATFVHDWAYLGLAVATVGHVVKAIQEPELLGSMVGGSVSRAWAATERPGWTIADADAEALPDDPDAHDAHDGRDGATQVPRR